MILTGSSTTLIGHTIILTGSIITNTCKLAIATDSTNTPASNTTYPICNTLSLPSKAKTLIVSSTTTLASNTNPAGNTSYMDGEQNHTPFDTNQVAIQPRGQHHNIHGGGRQVVANQLWRAANNSDSNKASWAALQQLGVSLSNAKSRLVGHTSARGKPKSMVLTIQTEDTTLGTAIARMTPKTH